MVVPVYRIDETIHSVLKIFETHSDNNASPNASANKSPFFSHKRKSAKNKNARMESAANKAGNPRSTAICR